MYASDIIASFEFKMENLLLTELIAKGIQVHTFQLKKFAFINQITVNKLCRLSCKLWSFCVTTTLSISSDIPWELSLIDFRSHLSTNPSTHCYLIRFYSRLSVLHREKLIVFDHLCQGIDTMKLHAERKNYEEAWAKMDHHEQNRPEGNYETIEDCVLKCNKKL